MLKQTDKQLHFLGGVVLTLSVSLFFGGITGLIVAVMAGLLKEAYDSLGFGTPDRWDAIATIAGGLLGFLLIMISEFIK